MSKFYIIEEAKERVLRFFSRNSKSIVNCKFNIQYKFNI